MTDLEIKTLMYEALETPRGVSVATSDPDLLKRRIYSIRNSERKNNNREFDQLSIRTSPTNPSGSLWLVKTNQTEETPE